MFLISRRKEICIFLPPLSTDPHPYKEEDAAGEGPDGRLW